MAVQTFAHALINSYLPDDLQYKNGEVVNKNTLKGRLVAFAKRDADRFNELIPLIKQAGDMFATYEGISVGLDDIEPDYTARDEIVNRADNRLRQTSDARTRSDVYVEAQQKMSKLAESHKGDLGLMARSGGRGNVAQLMKTVASPVVVGDIDGKPVDLLIKKSYAEGLSPAEYWVAGDESRGLVIKGQLGTAEPGDVSKILANTVNRHVVSTEDCNTKNGLRMSASDSQVIGRYLARDQQYGHRNDEIDARLVAHALEQDKNAFLFVRSPLTCEAAHGTCSFCQGIMNNGKRLSVGENAGLRAAQALSEPLTQMALSSKHGVALVEGSSKMPRGLTGLRQFLEAPKSFAYRATLAQLDGNVTGIRKAPQGGHYVQINNKDHYVPPDMTVDVKIGDKVEKGDALSEGMPHPGEVVEHKGLGEGRRYLTDQVQKVYEMSGISVDKRNVENIVVNSLGHVRVEDSPLDSGLIPGEVINQSKIDSLLREKAEKIPVSKSKGRVLAENYIHHVAGTTITDGIIRDLSNSGITTVSVTAKDAQYAFSAFMSPITRSPLLNTNWLNKLGHRYLKSTIVEAAQRAESASTSGYEPIAAYTRGGKSFGKGSDGRY